MPHTHKGYVFAENSTTEGRDAVFATRQAVKAMLTSRKLPTEAKFLVGLSGGADSLALAAAVAHVAPKLGFEAGAVIVNHNLQEGSAEVAEKAVRQATELGLSPVIVKNVDVTSYDASNGPEAVARDARYDAFMRALTETNSQYVLLAHTTDDNAEQVLLGLMRGSGTRSLAGMPKQRHYVARPFVDRVSREQTELACVEQGLEYWSDPHNDVLEYTRVRVRKLILPYLKEELGSHLSESLNRTAEICQEDADALDEISLDAYFSLSDNTRINENSLKEVELQVDELLNQPPAIRNRIIRLIGSHEFARVYSREHVLAVVNLIVNWKGQKPVQLPGTSVSRKGNTLRFTASRTASTQ